MLNYRKNIKADFSMFSYVYIFYVCITYHHLETLQRDKTYRKTGETVERWTWQLLEGYHLAEDSAREGEVETVCRGIDDDNDDCK